jgi:hypothetical protein
MLPTFNDFPSDAITVEFWMWSVDTCRKGAVFSYAHGEYEKLDNAFLIFNYNRWGAGGCSADGGAAGAGWYCLCLHVGPALCCAEAQGSWLCGRLVVVAVCQDVLHGQGTCRWTGEALLQSHSPMFCACSMPLVAHPAACLLPTRCAPAPPLHPPCAPPAQPRRERHGGRGPPERPPEWCGGH